VVGLHLAAIAADAEQGADAFRLDVGKKHDLTVDVTRSAARSLNQ
jgi:hypothetical protein